MDTPNNASATLTLLTRLGFAARGILYLVIGFLIIGAGRTEDTSGALQYVAGEGGRPLLVVIIIGLIAYGIWRLSHAAFDIERHGSDQKGLVKRLGAGISGMLHLLLAWQAVRLFQGTVSQGGGSQEGARTALELPGGAALLMLAGVILIGVGGYQFFKAWKASFLDDLERQVADKPWALWSGRAGYAARGLVFVISGFFVIRAGLEEQASEAGGMAQALSWLESPTDLIVAAGLFCFGVFSLIEARYRILQDVPVGGIARRMTGR